MYIQGVPKFDGKHIGDKEVTVIKVENPNARLQVVFIIIIKRSKKKDFSGN